MEPPWVWENKISPNDLGHICLCRDNHKQCIHVLSQFASSEVYKQINLKILSVNIVFNFIKEKKLENVFMKHYAPNHVLAPKNDSSQKGVLLKP